MKKSQLPVCACDQLPGMHHPKIDCDGDNIVVFTDEEIEEQKHCEHEESIFDGVCATCGFVDELPYREAEEISK